jgi:RES domain
MSFNTWTQDALQSSATRLSGKCWRVVEAQHQISTMKITDTLAEQAVLEDLLEETKPRIPKQCAHLGFLLLTPFRYSAKNPYGSRFRRSNSENGVFYAAEQPSTAIAETAFHRTLFYAESPATPWPTNPGEYTAFSCAFKSDRVTDIARTPYLYNAGLYHLSDYSASQAFADAARSFGFEIIKYKSMRDPKGLANLAILHCTVFTKPEPLDRISWKLHLDAQGARALCESPRLSIEYDRAAFASDPRLANFRWDR